MVTKGEDAVVVAPKDNLQQRLSPDSIIHVSHADREGNQPVVPEKPSEDGYNWRKYGQKNVKGNEYIRSYYKCSYPNCQVKKQVERSHEGRITDITYLGKHDHAKPHSEPQEVAPSLMSVQVQIPNCPASAVEDKSEDKSTVAHASTMDTAQPMERCEHPTATIPDRTRPASTPPSNLARDDCENLTPKKRKKVVDGADMAVEKPGHESRVVIHTVSEVDIVNDGYRWRKYGQKMVKGNPNPRSYYRCSTAGCPVKKHVERDSHNPKVVITTYEGQHDHSMPPVRMIVPQSAAPSAGGMEPNGISQNKSEESDSAPNGTIPCKAENDEAVNPTTKEERNAANVVKIEPESKPSEQEAEKDDAVNPTTKEESNAANVVKTEPESKPSEEETQHKVGKGDPIGQTANEQSDGRVEVEIKPEIKASDEKVQDPDSAAPNPDNINQTAKDEKVATVRNLKLEVVSTDKQRPDPLLESSHQKAEPNGRQRLDAEPVNC